MLLDLFLSQEEQDWIIENGSDTEIRSLYKLLDNPLWTFEPRPDQPHIHDEMTSFLLNQGQGISVLLGGNGSAKTYTGAVKTALLLLTTPPPVPYTPFWICGQNFEMAAAKCWRATLSKFIPRDRIETIKWHNKGMAAPSAVVLKPDPSNGNRWQIEFKSIKSDRDIWMGPSIYGWWSDEYVPMEMLRELTARTRLFNVDGSTPKGNQFYTLTPITIESLFQNWYEDRERFPNLSWHHLNTRCNPYVPPTYLDDLRATELEERWDTIEWGSFSNLTGSIYKHWNSKIHIVEPYPVSPTWHHTIGIDPGIGKKFATLWAAKDAANDRWVIYDEYWQEDTTYADHAKNIRERHPEFKTLAYCDPTQGGVMYEMLANGVPSDKARNDVDLGISEVRRYMKVDANGHTGLHVFSNCKRLIEEIKDYHWHPLTQKPVKDKDDMVDCLRYIIYSEKGYSASASSPFKQKAPTRFPQVFAR